MPHADNPKRLLIRVNRDPFPPRCSRKGASGSTATPVSTKPRRTPACRPGTASSSRLVPSTVYPGHFRNKTPAFFTQPGSPSSRPEPVVSSGRKNRLEEIDRFPGQTLRPADDENPAFLPRPANLATTASRCSGLKQVDAASRHRIRPDPAHGRSRHSRPSEAAAGWPRTFGLKTFPGSPSRISGIYFLSACIP